MSKWKVKKENGARSHILDEDDMYVAEMIHTPLAKQIVKEHNDFNDPMTSVIRWKRYDGTVETLPDEDVYVFVRKGSGSFPAMRIYTNFKEFIWKMFDGCIDIEIGDLWAYLQTPETVIES